MEGPRLGNSVLPELLDKLTQREKARHAAQREATASVHAAEYEVTQSAEKLMEEKRAQEQELRVLRAGYEKKIRDLGLYHRQRVNKAQEDLNDLEAAADRAEKRQELVQVHVVNLQQKLKDLKAHVAKRSAKATDSVRGIERIMDHRVRRVSTQVDGRIENMYSYVKQVRESSSHAIEVVGTELQNQMGRAHRRGEEHARFKELCDLATRCSKYEMSEETYHDMKAELISLWREQATVTPSSCSMAPLSQSITPWPESVSRDSASPFGYEPAPSTAPTVLPAVSVTPS
mmetsp:Transcript_93700/g.201065  ORF Transcript_93700/g.201065 Transcript_93700/m.201065 type:complete len:288 (-) Transcript_93700:91-954(-)